MIETLTEAEREELMAADARCSAETSDKALSTIDALTARVAELERDRVSLVEQCVMWKRKYEEATANFNDAFATCQRLRAELDAANARAEERESAALARVKELEHELEELESEGGAELDAANARTDAAVRSDAAWQAKWATESSERERAESEAASLREQFRVQAERANDCAKESSSLRLALDLARKTANEETERCASLRAEVERLRIELGKSIDEAREAGVRAHTHERARQRKDRRLAAATELPALWERQIAEYPPSDMGRAAAAAVTCCARELREALANAPASPRKTLEMRMAELGLHHIGESRGDVEKRLANAPAEPADLSEDEETAVAVLEASGFGSAPTRADHERAAGDDLEAALACLRSHEPDVRIIGNVRAELDDANARAEAAEQKLIQAQNAHAMAVKDRGFADLQRQRSESETAQWKAKCEAAERSDAAWQAKWATESSERERAESEAASLRAEVERQKKLVELAELSATAHRCKSEEAQARLAAATELLRRHFTDESEAAWEADANAFLANATAAPTRTERIIESGDGVTIKAISVTPAEAAALNTGGARIPPARTDVVDGIDWDDVRANPSCYSEQLGIPMTPTRTDHERAVLEALQDAPKADLEFLARPVCGNPPSSWMGKAAVAELARREAGA